MTENGKTAKSMPVLQRSVIRDVIKNLENNDVIIKYYTKLGHETQNETIKRKVENVTNCSKFWNIDLYRQQRIKNVKNLNHCKDKFCFNCKKVKQAARLSKYMPVIQHDLLNLRFMTLTVPNCSGSDLNKTIKNMVRSFRYLYRLLRGDFKVKGYEFNSIELEGCIRSLEITFNGNDFHPHFHVLIKAKLDIETKDIINKFSYSYGELKNKFSETETLIQKMWYCIINNHRLNRDNINRAEGYSCHIENADQKNVYEIFKYMTKSKNEYDNLLSYETFKHLYFGTYRIKQIQGYGCYYRIDDSDSIMDDMVAAYKELLENLNNVEEPIQMFEKPVDLLKDRDNKIISFKQFVREYKDGI